MDGRGKNLSQRDIYHVHVTRGVGRGIDAHVLILERECGERVRPPFCFLSIGTLLSLTLILTSVLMRGSAAKRAFATMSCTWHRGEVDSH